jgi:uncharacterized Zn-binding protein involved in type VI secretion
MAKGIVRVDIDMSKAHKEPDYEVAPGAKWDGSVARKNAGSKRTFVNGNKIMRQGDSYRPHAGWKHVLDRSSGEVIKVPDSHSKVIAGRGSSNVFVEGKVVHLEGDAVICSVEKLGLVSKSKALTGSKDVLVGE